MKRTLLATAVLLLLPPVGGAQDGGGAPWRLTFKHGPLDVISLTYGDGTARFFYYFTFTLENKSEKKANLAMYVRANVRYGYKKNQMLIALPAPDVEEAVRRLSRTPELKNVQQINAMGSLDAGQSVKGIAVLGTFNRRWDDVQILVSGLESRVVQAYVRKYGAAGFTLAHKAYLRHNTEVLQKAGKGATFTGASVLVKHDVVWWMGFKRHGDEFQPYTDPVFSTGEGWEVRGPTIVHELKPAFGG